MMILSNALFFKSAALQRDRIDISEAASMLGMSRAEVRSRLGSPPYSPKLIDTEVDRSVLDDAGGGSGWSWLTNGYRNDCDVVDLDYACEQFCEPTSDVVAKLGEPPYLKHVVEQVMRDEFHAWLQREREQRLSPTESDYWHILAIAGANYGRNGEIPVLMRTPDGKFTQSRLLTFEAFGEAFGYVDALRYEDWYLRRLATGEIVIASLWPKAVNA